MCVMEFAPVYLLYRLFYLPVIFLHHWYIDGSRAFGHALIATFERVDETIAIRVTLKHYFQPLYKDYSIVGRILGIVFRSGRIVIGLVVYLAIAAVFIGAYLAWVLIPPAIIAYAVRNV